MSYKTLIQKDAINQELTLMIVDNTGALHPEYGRTRVSLRDLRWQQTLNGSNFGLQGARFHAVHTVLANAPVLASVVASSPVLAQRLFSGSGAPSSSTLAAGNGMYCASASGFVVDASLLTTGAAYTAGQVLTVPGGTGTAAQVTVDTVGSSGEILTYHVSRLGNYTVYPTNPVSISGGSSFNLAIQPADAYLDISTPATPKLYVCTTRGTNATSVWALVSGAGSSLPVWI